MPRRYYTILPTPRRHRNTALTSPARRLLYTHTHTHTRTRIHLTSTPQQSISVAAEVAGAVQRWGGGERRQTAIAAATAEYVQSCAHRAHGSFGVVKKSHRRRRRPLSMLRESRCNDTIDCAPPRLGILTTTTAAIV